MVAAGKVIPKDSCFKYTPFEDDGESVSNVNGCTPFSAKLVRGRNSGDISHITTEFAEYKTNINKHGIGNFEKQKEMLIPYQRK